MSVVDACDMVFMLTPCVVTLVFDVMLVLVVLVVWLSYCVIRTQHMVWLC